MIEIMSDQWSQVGPSRLDQGLSRLILKRTDKTRAYHMDNGIQQDTQTAVSDAISVCLMTPGTKCCIQVSANTSLILTVQGITTQLLQHIKYQP